MQCKINNISINYEIVGKGKPIIMLHGYYVDHRIMFGCMEPIFKDKQMYKRIYIDLPGMGKSESAEWIINSDIILDIIIKFIEKIIPNENFLIAGQSYGGYLARGVISKMITKVDGALLICPVIIADYNKRNLPEHIILKKDSALLDKLTPEEAEDFNSGVVVQSEKIYERFQSEIISGVKVADRVFLENIQNNGYAFSFDVDTLKSKFDKPVLILLGRQDSVVGYNDAWNILLNFPRCTFAILDRTGHSLQIENDKLFNTLINDWLVRVYES